MKTQKLNMTVKNHIVRYISCDCLRYGDYDNSCAVERANVEYLLGCIERQPRHNRIVHVGIYANVDSAYVGGVETYTYTPKQAPDSLPGAILLRGLHGYHHLFVPDNADNREMIDSLSRYPVLDDDTLAEVEAEMIDQAWTDYGCADAMSAFGIDDTGEARERYYAWSESTGEYPHVEAGGSVYFPMPKEREEENA